jgi:hypothetical protein
MLLISARWANKNAQLALGMAYLNGVGFKQDRPLGLAWLSLACECHVAVYQGICDAAKQGASASERHLAAQQLAQLQSRYSDAAVADRAYRQYRTASAAMLCNPVYGGPCLAGLDLIVAANSSTDPDGCVIGTQMKHSRDFAALRDDYFAGWIGVVEVGAPAAFPIQP